MSTRPTNDQWHDIEKRDVYDRRPPWVPEHRWDEYRRALKAAERLESGPGPVMIGVELNAGCNMACSFCLHGHSKIENTKLGRERFITVITQARIMGASSLKLNNTNEPLLLPDLDWYVHEATERGYVHVYFVTNGLALRGAAVDRLLRTRLTNVSISLDAHTAETYDKQRKSGVFEAVKANVLDFIAKRNAVGTGFPLVVVSFMCNEANQHEQEAFVAEWTGVADIVAIQRANAVPNVTDDFVLEHGATGGCKFPMKQMMVTANGDIMPCCKFHGRELKLGNIADMTMREAWASAQWIRDAHATDTWDAIDACYRCLGGRK